MKIDIQLDKGAKTPTKAHETDAGFDIYSPVPVRVPARGSATINTGVHILIPRGYVGMLKSKSGLNVKHNITCEGTIDSGFTGAIVAKLFNHGSYDKTFEAGEKITQLVLMPILEAELIQVDTLPETDRGSAGFGSSGRF
jgi:dUTP pyrophosphatase